MLRIITDSAADVPPALREAHGIWAVPAIVRFGAEAYRDGVDLSPDEFYARMANSAELPATAAAAPGAYAEAYRRAVEQGDDVLMLTVTSRASSIYASASLAAAEFGERVAVVDTLNATMGQGLLALRAAEAVRAGASLGEARRLVEALVPRAHLYVLLDTLENLRRGGRIGGAAAWLGSLLSIKPIIAMVEGEIHPVERVRTLERAVRRIVELTLAHAPEGPVAIGYTDVPETHGAVRRLVEQAAAGLEIVDFRAGPAIGTHAGHGAVGIAFIGDNLKP
ncbi:MAG: DegV family protein [Chloroflexota bacterium]